MVLRQKGIAPGNSFLESLTRKFDGSVSNFVLGNAEYHRGFPIIYCSDGFCQLTGYTRRELIGKSCDCRFLYGMETNYNDVHRLKNALAEMFEFKVEIHLTKKNGSSFLCALDVIPIKNEKSEVVLFLVSHKEIVKELTNPHLQESNSPGTVVPKLRKFSRDVLFHLQRQYSGLATEQKSRSHQTTAVGTESQFIPQYKLENTKLPKLMLLHFGRARLLWDWLILLLVAYIAITVPFNAAFKVANLYILLVDLSFELIFICDIVINFRTTYIESKSGRLITNPRDIARNYIKGWFLVDCLAAIPFELLLFVDQNWYPFIALLKTGRLLRLFRVGRRINRYIEYTATLLILMMFSFALLAHWFACIWYVIGYEELKSGKSTGWLYLLGNQVGKPFRNQTKSMYIDSGEQYISALYFVFTSLTTVGFGNISPNTVAEKTFSVLVLLLGAIVQSAIFGNMTAVIQKMYAARARFHAKASQIKQFVRHHQIDGDLRRRIEDWFISHWSISKGVNTEEMLESFPTELQADISLHLYRSFLTLPCFMHASRGCLRSISLKVKKAYFSPGELVIKEKDAINALFFVQRGTVEIVQQDFIVAILGTGDLFGEDISKPKGVNRSNGDVRALMYCDVLYLTRENIKAVARYYPDFCEPFSRNIGISFDLSKSKKKSPATVNTLGSILEENEDYSSVTSSVTSNTSSDASDDDQPSDRRIPSYKRKTSRSRAMTTNKIPLWQQKLRNQELKLTSPPNSLKNCLMKLDESTDEELPIIQDKMLETTFSEPSNSHLINDYLTDTTRDGIDQLQQSDGNQPMVRFQRQCTLERSQSGQRGRKPSFPFSRNSIEDYTQVGWIATSKDMEEEEKYLDGVVIENASLVKSSPSNSRRSSVRTPTTERHSIARTTTDDELNIENSPNCKRKRSRRLACSNEYFSVPSASVDEVRRDDKSRSNSKREMNLLDCDQGIYSQCSDNGSYDDTTRRWSHNETRCNTDYDMIRSKQPPYIDSEHITIDLLGEGNYQNQRGNISPVSQRNIELSDLDNVDSKQAWSNLAIELGKLKTGDVQEMKNEVSQLRNEIHLIKNGMDSLTELVRTALLTQNK